jgi:hypothetical protein
VESVRVLTNALVTAEAGYAETPAVERLKQVLLDAVSALEVPRASAPTSVTFAVLLPVPDLQPITLSVPHALGLAEAERRIAALVRAPELGLAAAGPEGGETEVRAPLAGNLRAERERVVVTFDAPMWVPAQRARFESMLSEALARFSDEDPR